MMNMDFSASREALLMQINQSDFAAVDTNLYLDTHPCDTAAIQYHQQMADQTKKLRRTYEAAYGPLIASENTGTAYWSWITGPWPWEGGCC